MSDTYTLHETFFWNADMNIAAVISESAHALIDNGHPCFAVSYCANGCSCADQWKSVLTTISQNLAWYTYKFDLDDPDYNDGELYRDARHALELYSRHFQSFWT